MERRSFIAASTLAVAPAIVRASPKRLRLATGWPAGAVGAAHIPARLVERVKTMSDGELDFELLTADKSGIAPLALLDAVAKGDVDAAHTTPYYWTRLSQGFTFFATVPMGMMANEHYTWLRYGGGMALWEKLGLAHGVVPLACGNTGVQTAGWFRDKLLSLDSLKGLKIRFPGLGGEVLKAMGAQPVLLPAAEIKPALRDGRIDAAEWISPWPDLAMGLPEIVNHCYYPGIHEPGHTLELLFHPAAWQRLKPAHQEIVRSACWLECLEAQAQFGHENARHLDTLRRYRNVQVLRLPNDITREFRRLAPNVIRAAVESDPLARQIHDSYFAHLREQLRWAEMADRAYWQARYI
jgi:TRAP-type mannitol/chloroaromatic compound transport system substrate-binding protein